MEPIERPRELAGRKIHFQSLAPEAVAQEFCTLYPSRQSFIWKLPGCGHWKKANGPLRDHRIIGVISDMGRGQFRGCYWGEFTRFAVLDVDQASKYHNPAELAELAAKLFDVGLTLTPYQSSASGGWHLYLFFDQWVNSEQVSKTLRAWLRLKGYEIKSGVLEVFPSGNALRLPLQPGFAWLNAGACVVRRREEINKTEALASFLMDLESNASSWGEAKIRMDALIEADRKERERHQEAISLDGLEHIFSSGKIEETWRKGREFWKRGLFENGQRHDAVFCVGHYLWYGDPVRNVPAYPGAKYDRARARIIEEWLRKKHNGYCRHINEGQWDSVIQQIERAVIWRGEEKKTRVREPYPLTERLLKRLLEVYRKTGQLWEVSRLEAANNFREEEARARIAEAVKWVIENQAPLTISEVARVAGACWKTVKRHSDLLTISGGVYITWGVRGGLGSCDLLTAADDLNCQNQDFLTPSFWASDTLALADQPGDLSGEEKKEILPPGRETQGNSSMPASQVAPTTHPSSSASPAGCADGASLALSEELLVIDWAEMLGCLTPRADEEVGRRRTADGRDSWGEPPPSPVGRLAQGSSTDLEGLGYACGISSLAALSPVFLGDIYISGLRSGQLRHEGGVAGSVGGQGPVCYTAGDIASGIKEVSGATCRMGVRASLWAKREGKKTIPDATNYKFLTTGKAGYSSGFPDEFSLILPVPPVCYFADVQAGSANVFDSDRRGAGGGYRIRPACSSDEPYHYLRVHSGYMAVSGISASPQTPVKEAYSGVCNRYTHSDSKRLRHLASVRGRAPPICVQPMSVSFPGFA